MSTSAVRRNARAWLDLRHLTGLVWRRWSDKIEAANWNARYLAWLREHCPPVMVMRPPPLFATRAKMYSFLAEFGEHPITYLEFGVYKGESLAAWAKLNTHPNSQFHGFDSFEGLPAEDGAPFEEGHFKTNVPTFDDPRITLHEGWFNETLPDFTVGGAISQPLVINMDADLYSSTLYVLTYLDIQIPPGTIIMFDEMSVAQCEFRALIDWSTAYRRSYEVIAGFSHGRRVEGVAIRML